jgi:hypothetical protein
MASTGPVSSITSLILLKWLTRISSSHSHPIHLVNRSVPINFNNLIALLVRDFDNTTKVFVSCYRQYGADPEFIISELRLLSFDRFQVNCAASTNFVTADLKGGSWLSPLCSSTKQTRHRRAQPGNTAEKR